MSNSVGGSYVPSNSYNRVGSVDSNGTYQNQKVSGPMYDTAGVNRIILNPVTKALTSGSAVSLFNVARPTGAFSGGLIHYDIQVSDGTDFQSLAGIVTYASVDKAGTGTFTITELATTQAKAVSTGTLTVAWTYVTGTGLGTVKVNPTTSLTATTLQIFYTVFPTAGVVTIL